MLTRHHHDLTYLEYATPKLSHDAPLLIMLHGYGSNEKDLISLASMLPDNLRIVSARAPQMLAPEMYAWFPLEFVPNGIIADEAAANDARVQFIGFVHDVLETYKPAGNKAFLMGFSQGAVMSYMTAFTAPQLLHGVVACSGRLPEKTLPTENSDASWCQLPFLVMHGTYDDVISIDKGREAQRWLQERARDVTYREYPMAHQICEDEIALIDSWLKQRMTTLS